MSFGDISASRGNNRGFDTGAERDTLAQLKSSLAQFQKSCASTKEKVTEMRRRKVSQNEKSQFDSQLRDLRTQETQLKTQFDNKFKEVNALPNSEGAMQRATISKLFKDYERLKVGLDAIVNESQLIKVDASAGNTDSFNRTTGSSSSSYHYEERHEHREQVRTQTQTLDIKPLVQLQDIDEIILEERERDIQKINQDLAMVNDMFERMAAIVEEQGGYVEKIHTATEESHEKAQQGLEQVKQAATYQPGCAIC